jgi:hypothetical protein
MGLEWNSMMINGDLPGFNQHTWGYSYELPSDIHGI